MRGFWVSAAAERLFGYRMILLKPLCGLLLCKHIVWIIQGEIYFRHFLCPFSHQAGFWLCCNLWALVFCLFTGSHCLFTRRKEGTRESETGPCAKNKNVRICLEAGKVRMAYFSEREISFIFVISVSKGAACKLLFTKLVCNSDLYRTHLILYVVAVLTSK